MTPLRPAEDADYDALVDLWYAGWHEAHAAHLPDHFLAERSHSSFGIRLRGLLPGLRMARDADGPTGFCAISTEGRGELEQLFVAPRARGTGLAVHLLQDAEARLAQAGCTRPRLYCLPENAHARGFYNRRNWTETGIYEVPLKTVTGKIMLPCIIFEKELAGLA